MKGIIERKLKKDVVQRLLYALGLIYWSLISFHDLINHPYLESSIKISYLTLYLIPAIILTIQIIRNNIIFWTLIFTLFSAFILISLYFVLSDMITRSGNHVKAIPWTLKDVLILILYFMVLGIIDWIIFKIKPKRTI